MFKKVFLIFVVGGLLIVACHPFLNSEVAISDAPIFTSVPEPAELENYASLGLTDAEIATLLSLDQVDEYPLYRLNFYADYALAALDQNPSFAYSASGSAESWACSLFAALADPQSQLYGRNFDWEFSPALLLYTDPPEGYAAVAMVDIAYLGFAGESSKNLTEKPLEELTGLLKAPYIPFDGLNEAGLAIGMAAVPSGNVPVDPAKPVLGSLGVMRAVLDGAASVEEALAILQRYHIDFEGGPSIHYLIADAQGQAALLEHQGGKIHIQYNDTPWLQATNFLNSAVDSPAGQCWRYDMLNEQLETTQGALTAQSAMRLLQNVSQNNTQWSVVYGLSTGEIHIALGRDDQHVYLFQLNRLER